MVARTSGESMRYSCVAQGDVLVQTALPITSPSTALSGGLGEGGDDGNAEVTQGAFWRRDVCAGDDCFRGTNGNVAGGDCLLDNGIS